MGTRVNWLAVTSYNRVQGHIMWINVSLDNNYLLIIENILEKLQLKSHNMGDADRIMEMPRTQSYHEPRGPYYINTIIKHCQFFRKSARSPAFCAVEMAVHVHWTCININGKDVHTLMISINRKDIY